MTAQQTAANASNYSAVIKENFKLLKRSIDPKDELLDQLSLVDPQFEAAKALPTADAKTAKLLLVLARCSPEEVEAFVDILRQNDHDHAANVFCKIGEKVPMSNEHYNVLNAKFEDLCQYVQPRDGLMDSLLSKNAFTQGDVHYVSRPREPGHRTPSYEEMSGDIVFTLMRKSDCCFGKFLDALNENGQSHVGRILSGSGELPLPNVLIRLITRHVEMLVNDVVSKESNLVEKLVAKGALSWREKSRVLTISAPEDMNDEIVKLISRKSLGSFVKFIVALNETNQQHIVNELGLFIVNGKIDVNLPDEVPEHERNLLEAEIRDCLNGNAELSELLHKNGLVSHATTGSILVAFLGFQANALGNLEKLKTTGEFNAFLNSSVAPKFSATGVQSFNLVIQSGEFQRQRNDNVTMMTAKHKNSIQLHASRLSDVIFVDDNFLNEFSLNSRQKHRTLACQSNGEKMLTLLRFICRQQDIAFANLTAALEKAGRLEEAGILNQSEESVNDSTPDIEDMTDKEFQEINERGPDTGPGEHKDKHPKDEQRILCQFRERDPRDEPRTYLRTAPYDCLFHDAIRHKMRSALLMRPALLNSAITRQQDTMRDEPEFFWQDVSKSNLLTFLYWCRGDDPLSVIQQNVSTLEKDPRDLTALTAQLLFLVEERSAERFGLLAEIKKLAQRHVDATLASEADVAFVLRNIGPQFYVEAVDRYEKIVKQWDSRSELPSGLMTKSAKLRRTVSGWRFHLAQTYNRLLNVRNREKRSSTEIAGHTAMFDRIWKLLQVVIDLDDDVYAGKAMTELVRAFEKSKTSDGRLQFPLRNRTPDATAEDALTRAPGDPYVLEKVGTYYRERGIKQNDCNMVKRCIEVLDKCPTRHVAWHHKGLAYLYLYKQNVGESPEKIQTESDRQFLLQAKHCFEKGNVLTNYFHCWYFKDLANVCSLLGEVEQANSHFQQADYLAQTTDTVYESESLTVYETWIEHLLRHPQPPDSSTAIRVYRKAVRLALAANSNKNVAHQVALLSALQRRGALHPTDKIIFDECAVLQKAKDGAISFIRGLKNSVDFRSETWTLVRSFLARSERDDPYAAYLYLTALAKADCVNADQKAEWALAVDVAAAVYETEAKQAPFNSAMRDCFRWLIRSRATDSLSRATRTIDVCILADALENPALDDLSRLLRYHLGLEITTSAAKDVDDETISETRALLEKSKSVIIADDGESHLPPLVEKLDVSRLAAPVCVVSFRGSDVQPRGSCQTQLPVVRLSKDSPFGPMARSLMTQWMSIV